MRRYWAFIKADGVSTLSCKADHSSNPVAVEITKETHDNIQNLDYVGGEWVAKTIPPRKLTREEIVGLFSDEQFNDISDSTNKQVKAFLNKLAIFGSFDTESSYFADVLNGLESLSLIDVGDSARILTEAQTLAGV